MLKYICVLGLLGSGIYLCGMKDDMNGLPGCSGVVAERATRLTASTSGRGYADHQSGILRVSMDDSDSLVADASITQMSGLEVDLDDLEGLDRCDVPDIIQFMTYRLPDRSVCISSEERTQFLTEVLQKCEAKKPDRYRTLTRNIRSIRSGPSVQLNADLNTIYGGTEYIVRKLLEKENGALSTKLLTEAEQRKAAEKTETRVKIVSGVATGMVFTAFILAQILSSVL